MNLRERIGIDLGQKNRIEDGLAAAIEHGVRYLDLKIDVAPNAIETLTDERVANIRGICDQHGIHVGIHTLSAVNVAEVAPHVRDGVDATCSATWKPASGSAASGWWCMPATTLPPMLRCAAKRRGIALHA